MTQKEYVPIHKLDHNQEGRHLIGDKHKTVEPYKVEIVDKDELNKKKKEKDNFLYDTPGILNDTQVNLIAFIDQIVATNRRLGFLICLFIIHLSHLTRKCCNKLTKYFITFW